MKYQSLKNGVVTLRNGVCKLLLFVFVLILFNDLIFGQDLPILNIDQTFHTSVVNEIIFTSDGQKLITVSDDKSIKIWNTSKLELIKTLYPCQDNFRAGEIYAVALSPDGKFLAYGGYPYDIQSNTSYVSIYNFETEQIHTILKGHTNIITDLTFSQDGKYLASCSTDSSIFIWDATFRNHTPVKKLSGHNGSINSISFTNNSNYLLSASDDKSCRIWNLNITKDVQNQFVKFGKHNASIKKVLFAETTKNIITIGADNKIILYDSNGKYIKQIDESKFSIGSACLTKDNKKLFVASDINGQIVTYLIPEGIKIANFDKHATTISAIATSPVLSKEGQTIFASASFPEFELKTWLGETGTDLNSIKSDKFAIAQLFFINNTELVFGRLTETFKMSDSKPEYVFSFVDYSIEKFNEKNINLEILIDTEVNNIAVSRISDKEIRISTGEKIRCEENNKILTFGILPENRIVIGTFFGTEIYDIYGKKIQTLLSTQKPTRCVTLSPNKKFLATGSDDGTVSIWNLEKQAFVITDIEKDSYADKSGLKVGDEIISLDNKIFYTKQQIVDFYKKKKSIEFKIKRNKEIHIITAEKEGQFYGFQFIGTDYISLPLLTFKFWKDHEWICFSPNGYYSCSFDGDKSIGWLLTHDIYNLAERYSFEQFFANFYRPELIYEIYNTGKTDVTILENTNINQSSINEMVGDIPSIKFLLPENRERLYEKHINTQQKKQEIVFEISGLSVGIARILLYQNDKLVVTKQINVTKNGTRLVESIDLDLVKGKNKFKVFVSNSQNTYSKPDYLLVDCQIADNELIDLHLFAIGINNYKNPDYKLNYALTDAQAFVNEIQSGSQLIFNKTNIHFLSEDRAVKENILLILDTICKESNNQDVFVFYYAGHGISISNYKTFESDFYIVPQNLTQINSNYDVMREKALSFSELSTYFSKIKANKQLVIFDACNAGQAIENIGSRGIAEEHAIMQLTRSTGVYLLAATGSSQTASEFAALKHGVFTYAILEAIRGKADAGLQDRKISVLEIMSWVNERVPELSQQLRGTSQYPKIFSKGDDFPIVILK